MNPCIHSFQNLLGGLTQVQLFMLQILFFRHNIANSLHGFHSTRTTQRSERCIEVANGVQADVEAVGDISLELADGFTILLRDVLYVPSLHRNLISVSRLDKDNYECYFGQIGRAHV